MRDVITLSKKELDRVTVLQQCLDGHITRVQAAKRLELSYRHTKRLAAALRKGGKQALLSKRRGKPSNNRIPHTVRQQVLGLIQDKYRDFGPTLACEKLLELHHIKVSRETLRKWMRDAGLWKDKKRKTPRVFQIRQRRPQFGELVQIDGSPHAWLEDRAPRCTLINFVDDATSKILYARFVEAETTVSYLQGILAHLERFGRPCAYYSDKHSIFRVNLAGKEHRTTQLGRALNALNIELINAHTPQAKGRVERSHKTLQDRLVKEMRLAGIQTMEEANMFLPHFITIYNRKFSVQPASPQNAHRPVLYTAEERTQILSIQEPRKLSKNLTCQFDNRLYQIQRKGPCYALRGATITVCTTLTGQRLLLSKGKRLPYTCWEQGDMPPPLADAKEINACVDQAKQRQALRKPWRPAPDHPWRQPVSRGSRPHPGGSVATTR